MQHRAHRISVYAPSFMSYLLLQACAGEASAPAPPEQAAPLATATFAQELRRAPPPPIGREVGLARHLEDGDDGALSTQVLIQHGRDVFAANWTDQDGGGRPLTKGTGAPISDLTSPLLFPRNWNRISGPDANSCGGCHNLPRLGGGGDIVANVFVLGQRFDFVTFSSDDRMATRGTADETGASATLDTVANSRATLGMFGSGYIELLAREMTVDLQAIRDTIALGGQARLLSKGIEFGVLARRADGTWDTEAVEGLPRPSLVTSSSGAPPSLVIRPFHQAGAVVSVREFTNNAYNHHHGIQAAERFGDDIDADGDGYVNELTRPDITAATIYQATLPVPGRVIPREPTIERAVLTGERRFLEIGCTNCHRSSLPLESAMFSEPNPFNPAGNLQPGEGLALDVDLSDPSLPGPRLPEHAGRVYVPAYTDLKLHDICSGPDDPNAEALNMHFPASSADFHAGNRRFLTKKLWGAANEPPYFHHGKFPTMREAILAHAGEAQATTDRFSALTGYEQSAIIEFLKTLQLLPEGTQGLIVDEHGQERSWPPEGTQLGAVADRTVSLSEAARSTLAPPD